MQLWWLTTDPGVVLLSLVWLNNGQAYKCKRHAADRFTIQMVSEEGIKKKYGL